MTETTTTNSVEQVKVEIRRKIDHHLALQDRALDRGEWELVEYHTGRASAFLESLKMLTITNEGNATFVDEVSAFPSTPNVTFHAQVWDREHERWESYGQGYTCAKAANKLADELLDRGYFARVMTDGGDE